jgi:hypothetical protein
MPRCVCVTCRSWSAGVKYEDPPGLLNLPRLKPYSSSSTDLTFIKPSVSLALGAGSIMPSFYLDTLLASTVVSAGPTLRFTVIPTLFFNFTHRDVAGTGSNASQCGKTLPIYVTTEYRVDMTFAVESVGFRGKSYTFGVLPVETDPIELKGNTKLTIKDSQGCIAMTKVTRCGRQCCQPATTTGSERV